MKVTDSLDQRDRAMIEGGIKEFSVVQAAVSPSNEAMLSADTRRSFLRTVFGTGAAGVVNNLVPRAFGQSFTNNENNQAEVYQQFAGYFDTQANPTTGLTLSYIPDPNSSTANQPSTAPDMQYGAYTYDSSLRILADDWTGLTAQQILVTNGAKILLTYAANNSANASENQPETHDLSANVPSGGSFEDIRITNFTGDWYNQGWDWGVFAGTNAWIGNAAIQKYSFIQSILSAKNYHCRDPLSASDRQLC